MFDGDAEEKKSVVRSLYESGVVRGDAVISTQVLQEFYVTVTRKVGSPLADDVAESVVRDLALLPVVQIDAPLILAAIGRARRHSLTLWDSLIIEGAIAGGATTLYSEDLQDGLHIGGLTVRNPFAESRGPENG